MEFFDPVRFWPRAFLSFPFCSFACLVWCFSRGRLVHGFLYDVIEPQTYEALKESLLNQDFTLLKHSNKLVDVYMVRVGGFF